MAKRCPKCGREFPATAKHCDVDATALVPARPWFASPRLTVALAVAAAGTLALWALPYLTGALAGRTVETSLARVSLPKLTKTSDGKLAITDRAATVYLTIENTTERASPLIGGVDVDLTIGGTTVGAGKLEDQKIELKPKSKRTLIVKVEVTGDFATAPLEAYSKRTRTTVGVKGTLRGSWNRLPIALPFESVLALDVVRE